MTKVKKLTVRQKQALKTRKALLESALKLFKEKDFDDVTVEEITQGAGTSKGSFYTYFKSKDAVILEQYKEIDEFYKIVYENLPKNLPAPEQIRVLLSEGINLFLKFGYEFVTIVAKNQLATKALPHIFSGDRVLNRLILKIVSEGQIRGEIREDLSEMEITDMILCYYRGLYIEWCYFNGEFDILNKGNQYLNLFIDDVLKQNVNQ
jgi:TetR/AcrR family transcriptional regulator, fatty acid metabolism regulator protein